MREIGWNQVALDGVTVDLVEGGSGRPLLYLHAGYPSVRPDTESAFLQSLAERFAVTAPTHPGFGPQPAPPWLTSVDDLAFLYLDLLEALDLTDVVLVGSSIGAWIGATMSTMSTDRVEHLVLVNPVGIKVSDRTTRDLTDIFAITDQELAAAAFADPTSWPPDFSALDDATVLLHARSREATGRYGWSPYLHHPKLLRRLARIPVSALVVHGEADRISGAAYAQAFARAIPGGEYEALAHAGHFPHLEAPGALADRIAAFAERSPTATSESVVR